MTPAPSLLYHKHVREGVRILAETAGILPDSSASQSEPLEPSKDPIINGPYTNGNVSIGTCFLSPYAPSTRILPGYSCPPGYFCPNVTPKKVIAFPQVCQAEPECMIMRLEGFPCEGQGTYEPVICPPGNYCPTPQKKIPCPPGYYCSTGSTRPTKCARFSLCGEGVARQAYWGGMMYCGIVDVILILLWMILKFREKRKRRRDNRPPKEDTLTDSATEMNLAPFASASSSTLADLRASSGSLHRGHDRRVSFDESILKQFTEPDSVDINIEPATPSIRQSAALQTMLAGLDRAKMNKHLRVEFRFEHLTLTLPSGKRVLNGVTGRIRPARVTAIMGPSGCGKTSLMNCLLSNRSLPSKPTGSLSTHVSATHDASALSPKELSCLLGFVPQDDVMIDDLTVRENLMYSARTRLPDSWTYAEVSSYVDACIECLDLDGVKHSIVGGESSRGVSGGEKKRVNIALEVVGAPLALFLDEPTSGLDSTRALKVARILQALARLGITIVTVIHQPRTEIFDCIDDLLLIAPGGKTAYCGPQREAIPHFRQMGYMFESGCNPADALLDILSLHTSSIAGSPADIVAAWNTKGHIPRASCDEHASNDEDLKHVVSGRGANRLKQVWLAAERSVQQQYRLVSSVLLEMIVCIIAGCLIGLVAASSTTGELYTGLYLPPLSILSPAPNEFAVPLFGLVVSLSIALSGAPSASKTFAEERSVFLREASAGHSTLSYFLGKNIITAIRIALASLHYTAFLCYIAQPLTSFWAMYAIVFAFFWCVYGLAILVSLVVRRENAALMAVVITLLVAVFTGFGPNLRSMSRGPWGWILTISYSRWAAEALYSTEVYPYKGTYLVQFSAGEVWGYTLNRFGYDIGVAIAIGVLIRVATYVMLAFAKKGPTRRSKRPE